MNTLPASECELVLDGLAELYGAGNWRVPYLREHAENPFQVLVGTILSQRTRDANTDRASALLFERFPDPRSLASAPLSQVESLIHGTGFFRTKARHIQAAARAIEDRFRGEVPHDIPSLLSLPGVGRKTANCVVVFGFGEPAVPVDTHVHRIANRLGWVRTRTPEQTEEALRLVVPRQYWIPLNPLLVQHGQNLCRPRGPRCEICPISEHCATGRALARGKRPPRREDTPRRGRSGASARGRRKAGGTRVRGSPRREEL